MTGCNRHLINVYEEIFNLGNKPTQDGSSKNGLNCIIALAKNFSLRRVIFSDQ